METEDSSPSSPTTSSSCVWGRLVRARLIFKAWLHSIERRACASTRLKMVRYVTLASQPVCFAVLLSWFYRLAEASRAPSTRAATCPSSPAGHRRSSGHSTGTGLIVSKRWP